MGEFSLFMEGDNPDGGRFKKPAFPHTQGPQSTDASTGDKRSLTTDDKDSPVFIKDDGTQVLSRDPNAWNVNLAYQYGNSPTTFKHDCIEMANLLNYQCAVNGHRLVSTSYDSNPILNHNATEFFDDFVERRNIPDAAGSDMKSNNVQLRNLFRQAAKSNKSE
jgi:hypothetical protein